MFILGLLHLDSFVVFLKVDYAVEFKLTVAGRDFTLLLVFALLSGLMCTFYLYEQSTADQQYKVAKANALAFDHLLMNKWKNERNLWMSACTFCVYIMYTSHYTTQWQGYFEWMLCCLLPPLHLTDRVPTCRDYITDICAHHILCSGCIACVQSFQNNMLPRRSLINSKTWTRKNKCSNDIVYDLVIPKDSKI